MPSVIFMPVDHDAATPLWRQPADELRTDISTGRLPSGRVVPSETTLMRTHGLARGTVRKAIDALAEEGLVVRVQGPEPTWSKEPAASALHDHAKCVPKWLLPRS
jgi:DNA-binding FadR family transcriptional regulator